MYILHLLSERENDMAGSFTVSVWEYVLAILSVLMFAGFVFWFFNYSVVEQKSIVKNRKQRRKLPRRTKIIITLCSVIAIITGFIVLINVVYPTPEERARDYLSRWAPGISSNLVRIEVIDSYEQDPWTGLGLSYHMTYTFKLILDSSVDQGKEIFDCKVTSGCAVKSLENGYEGMLCTRQTIENEKATTWTRVLQSICFDKGSNQIEYSQSLWDE